MYARSSSRALLVGTGAVALALLAPAGIAAASPDPAAAANGAARSASACPLLVPFQADHFSDPTRIDNRFLPMVPGTQHVYTGTANAGAHQIVSTVTDLTKVVDGVTTRVVHEVDIQDGQVTESELTLFAQDIRGDVWNLGEYPETFSDSGKFTGAPDTWVAGLRQAQPGIHMLAHPESAPFRDVLYLQGRAPRIDFLDCARVHSVDGTVTVPVGTFHNVLTTYETSPLESTTAIQTKEHAPGVGIVRVGAINDPEGETLVLSSNVVLGNAARQKADAMALQIDAHGRQTNNVWAQTPPARMD
jgi:hypothetical protein